MKIVNLTPHALNILDESGAEIAVIPSSGIARIATIRQQVGEVNDIPLYRTILGEPEGLPEPEQGTIYVVSGIFRQAYDRHDLYQPGELMRDESGRPIGCVGLSR